MIVVVEASRALPLVAMSITFRAGAAFDPPGKEGLARLVARMLRRGTSRLRATEIEDAVDLLGGEIGTEVSSAASHVGSEDRGHRKHQDRCASAQAKQSSRDSVHGAGLPRVTVGRATLR